VVRKLKERLSVSKRTAQKFYMERFNQKKKRKKRLKKVKVKDKHQVAVSGILGSRRC
jgi:hypothetical protein